MRPIESIDALNRAQPRVRIVVTAPDGEATARVKVEVAGGEIETVRGGERRRDTTGAYDLRLFRDGQLVATAPQNGGEVSLDPSTGTATIAFEKIKLPRRARGSSVEFSAYAFIADRVKGETSRRDLAIRQTIGAKRRAYVVAVGVNAYDDASLDLRFAVNDALRIASTVAAMLESSRLFDDVVTVELLAERSAAPKTATKAGIASAVAALAGDAGAGAPLLSGADSARLAAAGPDDFVVFTFSGHGFADREGNFYLVPSDTGPGVRERMSEALSTASTTALSSALSRFVSSDELAKWFRSVDAGEIVMIVDACQSAASVARDGFKPGPMGSRGLGQLAYDKRMRILAATQTDNVALENRSLEQGLLSYALVREGLEAWKADFEPADGSLFLGEWLAYGVARVPELYREVVRGAVAASDGEKPRILVQEVEPPAGADRPPASRARIQEPALFDFSRGRATLLGQRRRP
jgi:hypothetical protein